jgi:hypothetical protein
MNLSHEDQADLERAIVILENPGLASKLVDIVGWPVEKALALLPGNWKYIVHGATHKALSAAVELAVLTIGDSDPKPARNFLHRLLVAASGAGGGAFGLASLPVELPFSTGLMLRSIADIARSQGEDVRTTETKLACLEVFALGGKAEAGDAMESGYLAIRSVLAREVSEAAKFIAERGLVENAPAIVRLMTSIAGRFGMVVTEKVAAQAVPVIGAVGGALVNTVFMDHFQDLARAHFTIRRLERRYGAEEIRGLYRQLREKSLAA